MKEQLLRFIYWVKGQLHVVDVALPGLWIWAWFQNASGTHYDLDKLWQIYLVMRGFVLAQLGINRAADSKNYKTASEFNSDCGKEPGK